MCITRNTVLRASPPGKSTFPEYPLYSCTLLIKQFNFIIYMPTVIAGRHTPLRLTLFTEVITNRCIAGPFLKLTGCIHRHRTLTDNLHNVLAQSQRFLILPIYVLCVLCDINKQHGSTYWIIFVYVVYTCTVCNSTFILHAYPDA